MAPLVRRANVVLVLVLTGSLAWDRPLAAQADFFSIPTAASGPADIVVGPDGNLWFTETDADQVARITPAGVITEFDLPAGTEPLGIASNPIGIFIAGSASGAILRMNPNAGNDAAILASLVTLNTAAAGSTPTGIIVHTDSLLYFTLAGANEVARLGTAGGVILPTALTGAGGEPSGITSGPDNDVWFTAAGSDEIGRMFGGAITNEFPVPGAGSEPRNIASGSDGALWFTQVGSHEIGRITTAGDVTEFPLPAGTTPFDIAPAPGGGALVFTATGSPGIGRIDTGGASFIRTLAGTAPAGIVAGPDGNVWFTDPAGNQIGRLSEAALVQTVSAIPTLSTWSLLVLAASLSAAAWIRLRR